MNYQDKKRIFFIFILVIIAHISCFQVNPTDKLIFENEPEAVSDSIKKLVGILNKLSDSDGKNYFYDYDDNLYINNQKVGVILEKKQLDEISSLDNFTRNEKEDFLSLIEFLKLNEISSSYLHRRTLLWSFGYRAHPDDNFKTSRRIIFVNNLSDTSELKNQYFILDKKRDLILVSFKSIVN